VVIQDAESYQRMIDRQEYAESVRALRKTAADIGDSKKWIDADKAFKQLRSKYNLK
jgi:hypothetical protein